MNAKPEWTPYDQIVSVARTAAVIHARDCGFVPPLLRVKPSPRNWRELYALVGRKLDIRERELFKKVFSKLVENRRAYVERKVKAALEGKYPICMQCGTRMNKKGGHANTDQCSDCISGRGGDTLVME